MKTMMLAAVAAWMALAAQAEPFKVRAVQLDLARQTETIPVESSLSLSLVPEKL